MDEFMVSQVICGDLCNILLETMPAWSDRFIPLIQSQQVAK